MNLPDDFGKMPACARDECSQCRFKGLCACKCHAESNTTAARIERLVEKPDERFGWKVTRCNGWCVEVIFPSTPPGSIAQHLVVNCGDNGRLAHQIARDCELAAKAWVRSALTEFAEGK